VTADLQCCVLNIVFGKYCFEKHEPFKRNLCCAALFWGVTRPVVNIGVGRIFSMGGTKKFFQNFSRGGQKW